MKTHIAHLLYGLYRKLMVSGRILFRISGMAIAFTVLFYSCSNAQDLDVPYVSTPHSIVERMLDVANVEEGDYVVDLGCGDGRIVISAARRGAYGHGLDLDPERVKEAKENAREADVRDRVMFFQQDLFKADFSRANVITMYLLSSVNLKLRPVILNELEPGTRIVSLTFDMGEWEPDKSLRLDVRKLSQLNQPSSNPIKEDKPSFLEQSQAIDNPIDTTGADFDSGTWLDTNPLDMHIPGTGIGTRKEGAPLGNNIYYVYFWVVPADVEGQWQWHSDGKDFTMDVTQKFQELQLDINTDDKELRVSRQNLNGRRITFTAVNPDNGITYLFNGRTEDGEIKGKVQIRGDNERYLENWSATLQ